MGLEERYHFMVCIGGRYVCHRWMKDLGTRSDMEHKSGMIIPRYANTGEDCGSAMHGTIRRHQSWGLLTPTSYIHRVNNNITGEWSMDKKKKWLKITLGIMPLVIVGVYIGGIAAFHGKFLKNTDINGMDVSDMTVEEAEKLIREQAEDYQITLKERGNNSETITAEEIGYHYVSNGEIENFQKSQPYAL